MNTLKQAGLGSRSRDEYSPSRIAAHDDARGGAGSGPFQKRGNCRQNLTAQMARIGIACRLVAVREIRRCWLPVADVLP